MYEVLLSVSRKMFGDALCAVVVFGSSVYMGRGRDIDVLIVIDRDMDVKEKIGLELSFLKELRSTGMIPLVDVHILSLRDFEDNLVPGSFLSGLALGYRILLDVCGIEDRIIRFLERLSKEKYVLHNRYGSWNLSFYAIRLLTQRKRHIQRTKTNT